MFKMKVEVAPDQTPTDELVRRLWVLARLVDTLDTDAGKALRESAARLDDMLILLQGVYPFVEAENRRGTTFRRWKTKWMVDVKACGVDSTLS